MAPTPTRISNAGGGTVDTGKTAGQIIAIVLGIFLGPIILYILYDLTKKAIRIYIKPKECQRRDGELEGQPGVANRDTSMPAIPITVAPTANLTEALTNEAILDYWGTPRTSQDINHGVWTAKDKVYDPKTNPYLAARNST